MMGELMFFLRLQIKQINDGIFTNQIMYIMNMLQKFEIEELKLMNTSMSSSIKLSKDY